MALSGDQKTAIRKVWKVFTENAQENAMELFINFFSMSSHQQLFKDLAGKTPDELRASPKLKSHSMKAAKGISSMVDSLDDAVALEKIVRDNAKFHFPKKVQAAYFKDLAEAVIATFKQKLGDKFSSSDEAAFNAMFDAVSSISSDEESKQ